MSVLATDKKLISIGTDYSAGSGISIIDHTISVTGEFGKTYSAGPNIGIYDVYGQPTISSKDWSSDIANASSNAYEKAVSQIPEPQDLSYISARVDENASGIDYISSVCLTSHKDWTDTIKNASANSYTQSTSYFNDWINGQYTGDITDITNNLTALSGDLSSYYKKTETSSKEQINDALQYVSANAGKVYEGISPIVVNNVEDKISADTWTLSAGDGISFVEDSANKVTVINCTATGDANVNSFVTNNSAEIVDVNSSYKTNSGTFLTAIPSDVATTGDVSNLEQKINDTYYPKSNPSSFATESWVTAQGYLTAHQDISNKLDSSAFSSVSGDFLTTSFSIPESATWNDVSTTVQTNSAQWAEGGGSVSSKYGTISVTDNNIEATNKAIEFNSNGFTSSFNTIVLDEFQSFTSTFTWDNYSEGTTLTLTVLNHGDSDTLTYSSNTNVTGLTGLITAAKWTPTDVRLSIPNATAIQFSAADHGYELQNIQVSAHISFKVSELAWKTDLPTYTYNSAGKLSAINGSALVGNEDYLLSQGFVQNLTSPYGTIKVKNNKIEGTNSAVTGDGVDGFVSAYNGLSVYPGNSATLSWDRYVPNTILHVSGAQYIQNTLTYSADTGVTGQIAIPDNGENDIEVPTNSTSIVIGNENWGNMNYNFTVSAADSYEIGELAWASALPTYEYDSTNKISAINGSAIAGGSKVPSGTMNVSGLEYNAVNEISGYNGSAIAQPTLSSLNDANVNNIIVTASLPSTTDANTLYLIPEA